MPRRRGVPSPYPFAAIDRKGPHGSLRAVVVGRGRLGCTLASALQLAEVECELLPGRDDLAGRIAPEVSVVFLAVPDGVVPEVSERLAAGIAGSSPAVIHLSGALELNALASSEAVGLPVGSFHPLQPFAAVRPPSVFVGTTIAIEASDDPTLALLEGLAQAIGGVPRRVPDSQRSLYHASAVVASTYVVGLAAQAVELLEQMGWTGEEALASLLPLLAGAVDNLRTEGLPQALSGPLRRGDAATVRRHLTALESADLPLTLDTYRPLARTCIELARQIGLEEGRYRELLLALDSGEGGGTR